MNIAQAALGTEVEIQTFDGPQTVKVPEGVQHGEKIRLRGLGVPRLQTAAAVATCGSTSTSRSPRSSPREQRKLFEQLRETLPAENEPHEKSLLEKVKDYFV